MRKYLIFCISSVILLSGCATTPNNPWNSLTTETSPAATPLDCANFPLPTETYQTHVVYDKAGFNDLNAYRQCSEANEGIAGEHSRQIDQLKISRKNLTQMGRAQRNIADMKQEMLDDERRSHLISNIVWAGLFIAGMAL